MRERERVSKQQKSQFNNNTLYIQCAHRAFLTQALDSEWADTSTDTCFNALQEL